MKQNITYNRNGYNFVMQFDFCPKCSYFCNCYQMDSRKEGNSPNFINEECFDVFEKIMQEIREFIKSMAEASDNYPWKKDVKDIIDEDIEKIEELYAGSIDKDEIYAAVNNVLGINIQ